MEGEVARAGGGGEGVIYFGKGWGGMEIDGFFFLCQITDGAGLFSLEAQEAVW